MTVQILYKKLVYKIIFYTYNTELLQACYKQLADVFSVKNAILPSRFN